MCVWVHPKMGQLVGPKEIGFDVIKILMAGEKNGVECKDIHKP